MGGNAFVFAAGFVHAMEAKREMQVKISVFAKRNSYRKNSLTFINMA